MSAHQKPGGIVSRNLTRGSTCGLLFLSILWALDTLQPDLLPSIRSLSGRSLAADSIPFLLLAFIGATIARINRAEWPSGPQLWKAVFVGFGIFIAPALLVRASDEEAPTFTRTVLFAMTPIFATALEPYIGTASGSESAQPVRGALIAALLAVVGSLLVFPFAVPAALPSVWGMALATTAVFLVAACNCFACRIARTGMQHLAPFTAIAGAGTAAGFLAFSAVIEGPKALARSLIAETRSVDLLWITAIELPALLLLFWLLPRMSATRMTVRYLLAPLFTILIGACLLESINQIRLHTWLGLALMACGSGWLILGPEESITTTLDLNLNSD